MTMLSGIASHDTSGPSLFDNGDAHALLSASGWWWPSYTSSHAAWQPAGCFMISYSRKHVEQCLTVSGPVGPAINSATSYGAATASHPTSIYLIGDSQTRELFFAFAERFQPDIRTVTGDKWHADLRVSFEVALPAARRTATPSSATIDTVVGVNNSASIAFFWDPYLNRTTLHGLLTSQQARMDRPQMVVVGAGSWFIKNGLVDTFETAVEQFFGKTSAATMANVYVLPLTAVNEERLWEARRSLTNKGVTELNQFLHSSVDAMRQQAGGDTFHYVDALHEMTLQAPALAEDGLHYDTSIYRVASDVLLNAQCNRRLFDGKSPMQATCNTAYAVPNWKQVMTLLMLALLGPVCFVARMSGRLWLRARGSYVHSLTLIYDICSSFRG